MTELAITAMGPDRPGIIAALTHVLHTRGANVEGVAMTALSGHVAVVLQADAADNANVLHEALVAGTEGLDLAIGVGPAIADGPPPPPTHLLDVYGADQPGLLARVMGALADANTTVVDLTSGLIDDDGPDTWAMSIEVVAGVDDVELADALAAACQSMQVEHRLQRVGARPT